MPVPGWQVAATLPVASPSAANRVVVPWRRQSSVRRDACRAASERFGSMSVVSALMAVDLVDRLRLVVFPQILAASGLEPAFASLDVDLDLDLLSTSTPDNRLVVLEYHPRVRRSDE